MALSRDLGTETQAIDEGYGIVARRAGGPAAATAFPLETRVRVLQNHACATAAQCGGYHVLDANGAVTGYWRRFNRW